MKDREKSIYRVTIWGAVVNVALAAVKFIAGLVGRSNAMMADAVHSLSDLVSDVVVLVMVSFSTKGRDKGHDYGHGKFETLATACVSLLLVLVGCQLMSSGVGKIREVINGGTIEVPGKIALWAAIVSIIVKEILYQWTARTGKAVGSPAVVTNAWHHRTDALSSIGSGIGIGAAILFGGKWVILDPIVGCAISIFIFYIAVKMAIPALDELTDGSLPDDIEEEIIELARSTEGVDNVHALKTRRIGPNIVIEAHIVVNPQMTVAKAHSITEKVEERLQQRYGAATQISLHVEPDVMSK
ncbi:MAG: cation transporter [Bacteroidales bacterium]|nr:cation transporter [Bacteroidales bacterium]